MLSAAVAAQLTIIHVCYRPKEIRDSVDFLNLMAYDYWIHQWLVKIFTQNDFESLVQQLAIAFPIFERLLKKPSSRSFSASVQQSENHLVNVFSNQLFSVATTRYWPFTGHNSAMHARSVDVGIAITFNTEWAANYWHNIGLAKGEIRKERVCKAAF